MSRISSLPERSSPRGLRMKFEPTHVGCYGSIGGAADGTVASAVQDTARIHGRLERAPALDCASALALCEDVGATLTCSIRREPDHFTSGAVLSSRAADEV